MTIFGYNREILDTAGQLSTRQQAIALDIKGYAKNPT